MCAVLGGKCLQQGAHPESKEKQATEIGYSPPCEDGPTHVAFAVPPWVRVMKMVIRLTIIHRQTSSPRRGVWRHGELRLDDNHCQTEGKQLLEMLTLSEMDGGITLLLPSPTDA